MRPVVLTPQSDCGHPLIDEPGILPCADMISVIDPARKSKLANRSPSAFEPSQNAASSGVEELKLDRPTCLLPNDNRA